MTVTWVDNLDTSDCIYSSFSTEIMMLFLIIVTHGTTSKSSHASIVLP